MIHRMHYQTYEKQNTLLVQDMATQKVHKLHLLARIIPKPIMNYNKSQEILNVQIELLKAKNTYIPLLA